MATKKTTHKKAPAKRSSKKSRGYVSFKLQPNERPFVQFSLTRQTVYWSLISLLILVLGIYVVKLQMEISTIYDQIDTNSIQTDAADTNVPKKQT